ncbi:ribokinase [Ruania halotolerans]|uniref:ribokinase n=1 Tax=Ruania halotolerans TaxID=2897773 RepID=UPI001E5073E5|nr:ribokinase [Ruania halotolerans]UFU06940.1 ribokinase [Ruania halotolerans]
MGVVVVGSANMDVVSRVPRIPGPGETLLALSFARGGGGKGANQAVAAARAAGVQTVFVGAVGRDADGDFLRAGLAGAGVDTGAIATSEEPTGTALISVAEDGENAIVVVGGANAAFTTLSDQQRERVSTADVLLAQLEIAPEVVLAAAQARPDGARFVLNAAPSAPLSEQMWAEIDVLVVNEHEAADLAQSLGAPDRDLDAAVELLAERVDSLVVTLGGEGCLVVENRRRTTVPAMKVTPVDTTGAGDTFVGVLGARLALGDDLVEAARWGSVAAALAVQRPGAQSGVPSADEVRAAR